MRAPSIRWQGWGLIVLGLIVGLVSIHFQNRTADQQDCFVSKFSDLSSNLSDRGKISQREAKAARLEAKATRLESQANNQFYRQAFAASDTADVFDAYGKYRVLLAQVNAIRLRVDHRRDLIAKDRADNPIPDFPKGTCD